MTDIDGKKQLESGFQAFLKNIGDKIQDATSLDVATFTGDFTLQSNQMINNNQDKAEISNILKSMTVKNKTDLQLVAYTSVKIDADVTTIVKNNLNDSEQKLLELHKEMIASSRESRQVIIDMIQKLLSIKS